MAKNRPHHKGPVSWRSAVARCNGHREHTPLANGWLDCIGSTIPYRWYASSRSKQKTLRTHRTGKCGKSGGLRKRRYIHFNTA